MAADTNYLTTSILTDFLRTLYSADLLAVARPMLFYQQFCDIKREPGTQHAKDVYWTRVWDAPTYIGTLTENDGTVPSGVLDDEQKSVTVNEHGFVFKSTEYLEVTQYLNQGNLSGLIRDKIGVHMAMSLDTLARNAWLSNSCGNVWYAGTATGRLALNSTDKLTPDYVEQAVRNLKARDMETIDGLNVLSVIHPAQTYDLRRHSDWINAQHYAGATRIFTGEVGSWGGCRFIETTRARLPNAGILTAQTTVASDAAKGATTVTVTSATNFAANQEISIGTGATVDETDSTLEHCVIDSIAGAVLTLKRKLGFAHASGQYVTEAADVYPVIMFGKNPTIGCGIGLDPEVRVMPPSDDLGRLYRAGWYSIIGWGCLDSDAAEIIYTRASTDNLSMGQML